MKRSDETLIVDVVIDGEPASKSRARYFRTAKGKVGAYTPKATKQAEGTVAEYVALALGRVAPNDRDAFTVELEFHCKSYHRRDIDNMTKLVFDACNKLVWKDDAQVERMTAEVVRASETPRTCIRIYSFPSAAPYISCRLCGKATRVHPSWAGKIYCSRKCSSIAQQKRVSLTCVHCGKSYDVTAGEVRHKKTLKERQFCSLECKHLGLTIELTCGQCAKVYRKPRSQVRNINTRRHFCTETCQQAFWRPRQRKNAYGVCSQCGGSTSKKTYKRCRACSIGTWRNNLPS